MQDVITEILNGIPKGKIFDSHYVMLFLNRKIANKALHLTAIPLRSIAAGGLGRYVRTITKKENKLGYDSLTRTMELYCRQFAKGSMGCLGRYLFSY